MCRFPKLQAFESWIGLSLYGYCIAIYPAVHL